MDKRARQLIVLLAAAQFIFTLDTTVMNVSISTLVKDLNTTVTQIQSAITFYSLVMAAFMVVGAKIGDIIGRKKAFIIGMIVYGIGSSITAMAPNVQVLKFGWSLLEGLGAALAIPAMMSLIAGNFTRSQDRLKAYGVVAAMAGIGAALGPIVGGFLTTYSSWRLAFAGEVIVVIYILLRQGLIKNVELDGPKVKLDYGGVVLSVAGLATLVQGILMASTYGLFEARQSFDFLFFSLQPGQISPSLVFVGIGIVLLIAFAAWEASRARQGKDMLVNLKLLTRPAVGGGTLTIMSQQFVLGGMMYVLALYLQLQQGKTAFDTGVILLPLSICLLVAASLGARLVPRFEPRSIIRVGYGLIIVGVLAIALRSFNVEADPVFSLALAVAGTGIGLLSSQLQNLVQSSVTKEQSSETSGLMSTFQNLGMSLGTAIAGAALISLLIGTTTNLINQNTTLTDAQKSQYITAVNEKATIVNNQAIEEATSSLPSDTQQQVVSIYDEARAKALSYSFIAVALLGAFGLFATAQLPKGQPKVEA